MFRRPRGGCVSLMFGAAPAHLSMHHHVRDAEAENETRRSGSRGTPGADDAEQQKRSLRWVDRVQREMVSDYDPLMGKFHPDFFRDPASGYSPAFAPRNFSNGGAVEFSHPLSSQFYSMSVKDRDHSQHGFELGRVQAKEQRRLMREGGGGAVDRWSPLDNGGGHEGGGQGSIVDEFDGVVTAQGFSHRIGGRDRQGTSSGLHAGLDRNELMSRYSSLLGKRNDSILEEGLRGAHGIRAKEREDFAVHQRSTFLPFRGYDMDRFRASHRGDIQGMNPFNKLGNLVAPGSTAEAHENVRRNAVSERDAQIAESFHTNTVRADPKLGEALTDEVVQRLVGTEAEKTLAEERERKEKFGLGRQGPLVQDGGPDKRSIRRHKNDERLLKAMIFRSDAYRSGPNDDHKDPFLRNSISTSGVGHLLRNQFDLDKRSQALARGDQDVTERATQFYGKQIQEEIDSFVFRRRNARGDRPLEYFKPFPSYRDFRLQSAYRDLEGFPLMRGRPEFLEWELFCRYRAHFEQRREIALLHGLEPRPNETVAERDARRERLDVICERTPFRSASVHMSPALGELSVDAAALRAWFGYYLLPSPTIVEGVVSGDTTGLFVMPKADSLGTSDHREHVLSARYLNKLFLDDSYRHRIGRGNVKDHLDRIPDPIAEHKQPASVLQRFTTAERAVYKAYMSQKAKAHASAWEKHFTARRWVAHKQQYGVCTKVPDPMVVYDVERVHDGQVVAVGYDQHKEVIDKALLDAGRSLEIDKQEYRLLEHSRRSVAILPIRLDDGTEISMDSRDYYSGEPEADISDVNFAINASMGKKYHYNRSNYIETQDTIWEENCSAQTEGWSPATHADGLRVGLPVLCRRLVDAPSGRRGELQRGVITQYLKQPFFNPEPRTVSVAFGSAPSSTVVEHIPLAELFIWQRQYYGPERTVGDKSRKLNASPRRYVNVADPEGKRDESHSADAQPHFLDKYKVHSSQATAEALYPLKDVSEIDQWSPRHDSPRNDNYRPLSINHRMDYVRLGYFHRYTPWDWIATQEADQPLLWSQLRSDDVGPSYYHSPNRYWRWKARPHGYIRNFENEVRDLFQYVDGVTPWEKAKKIRTYWEVREHHPIPQFNRPQVAIHRNHVGLLPSQLWETDKKSGRVKAVKDSVRDYQTPSPVPEWSSM